MQRRIKAKAAPAITSVKEPSTPKGKSSIHQWLGLIILTLMACALLRVMDKLESGGGEAPALFESLDVEEEDRVSTVESLDQQRSKEGEEKEKEIDLPDFDSGDAVKDNQDLVIRKEKASWTKENFEVEADPVEKDKPTKDVKEPELVVEEKEETSVPKDKEPVKEAQGDSGNLEILPSALHRLNIVDRPDSSFTDQELDTPISVHPGPDLGKQPPPDEALMSPPTLRQIREQFRVSPLLPLSRPWGSVFGPNRVACYVPTVYPDKKWQIKAISDTWGVLCDKLYWVVTPENDPPPTIEGGETLVLKVFRSGKLNDRNIWEKMWRLWYHIATTPERLEEAEWFFKIDDDSFFSVVNFKGFSRYLDPEQPYYIGHTILWRWLRENIIFNSGICYALSRGTLQLIGQKFHPMPSMKARQGPAHCVDREGAGEDPTMGICVRGMGINPINTLDENLRNRFIIFRDTDHESRMWSHDPRDGDSYYWKYRPRFMGDSHTGCCSENLIAAHNYKMGDGDSSREYKRLNITHNTPKDWDSMPLPPRPRIFLYDEEAVSFKIDEFRNSPRIPSGQRVHFNETIDWYCWKCLRGDRFWRADFDNKYHGIKPAFKPLIKRGKTDKR